MLTKHNEPGGTRVYRARVIPRFAVVSACLVWAQSPQLQVGPIPVLSPFQQGPIVEPGWQVGNTTRALGTGAGLSPSHPEHSPGNTQHFPPGLGDTIYHQKSNPTPELARGP